MVNMRLGVTKGDSIILLNEYETGEDLCSVQELIDEVENFILEEKLGLDEEEDTEEYTEYKEILNIGWDLTGPEYITSLEYIDDGERAIFVLAKEGSECYEGMIEV